MDNFKENVIRFRDSALNSFWTFSQLNCPKLNVKGFSSNSIDVMIYQELYDTLPEDTFGLSFTFQQNTFLFVTQYRFQEPLLEAESIAILECISDGLFMSIRELAVLNRKEFKRDMDTLPFGNQYFFDTDKVVFMLFEIDIKQEPYQFALIFSQNEFENLNITKISA